MKSFLSKLWASLTSKGTLRYDSYGIHRSWNYNPNDEDEREAIKNLAEYTEAHGISQRYLDVRTDGNKIHHSIRSFMFGLTYDRYLHYLVYPDFYDSSPDDEPPYWTLTLKTAKSLDHEYHHTCPFKNTETCNYCNGSNENKIG